MNENKPMYGKFVEIKSINEKMGAIVLDVKGQNVEFVCFNPWTKKDGTAKKGIAPNAMISGKLYAIYYSIYQKPDTTTSNTATAIFEATPKDKLSIDQIKKAAMQFKGQVEESQQTIDAFIDGLEATLNQDHLGENK